jgi:hypothetical protein
MEPRLVSSILVGALVRRAEAEGGFAAVLAKGDATAGSILVILTEKGEKTACYERALQSDGRYSWAATLVEGAEKSAEVPDLIARRRRFDPDLWVVELDIPSIERFAAGMNAFD